MIKLILLMTSLSFGNETYFKYNDYNYGECFWTKAQDVLMCETKEEVCFITFNVKGTSGNYNQVACKKREAVSE